MAHTAGTVSRFRPARSALHLPPEAIRRARLLLFISRPQRFLHVSDKFRLDEALQNITPGDYPHQFSIVGNRETNDIFLLHDLYNFSNRSILVGGDGLFSH